MASHEGLIHLHCGDAAATVHRRSGLPGALQVWRDSPAVGPWAQDRERLAVLRTGWWGVTGVETRGIGVPQDPARSPEPVLWFGPDPWEQACLLWVLAELPEDTLPDLVPLDRGVGLLPPTALPPLFARRALLDGATLTAARGLWARFLDGGWAALDGGRISDLPWLAPALARLAEDHPPQGPGRTRRQLQALVDQGIRDLPGLMDGLRRLEAPQHGPWYGDLFVAKMVGAMGVRLG
jgi:hypothetical protein